MATVAMPPTAPHMLSQPIDQTDAHGDAAARPTSAVPEGTRKAAAGKQKEWTPWKDRIRSHKDAVIHVEIVADIANVGKDDLVRRCLFTASADGSVKWFNLPHNAPPALRQRLMLQPPAHLLPTVVGSAGTSAMTGTSAAIGSSATAGGATSIAGSGATAVSQLAKQTAAGKEVAKGKHAGLAPGSPFCTAISYCGRRPSTSSAAQRLISAEHGLSVAEPQPPDVATVFVGYEAGYIVGFDAMDGRHLFDLIGHDLSVTALHDCTGVSAIKGHEDEVTLLSASHDGTIRAWRHHRGASPDMVEAACLFTLEVGARNPVADLQLLQGPRLPPPPPPPPAHEVKGLNTKMKQANAEAAAAAAAAAAADHAEKVAGLAGRRLLIGAWDGQLRSVDLKHISCTNILQASTMAPIRCMAAAEDGLTVYVGTEDCHVSCLQFPAMPTAATGAGKTVNSWKAHNSHVLLLRLWSNWLISGSEDRLIKIWAPVQQQLKKQMWAPVQEFVGHSGAILAMCISQDDCTLWTGSRDWSIRSWDLAEAEKRAGDRDGMQKADKQSRSWERERALLDKEKRKVKAKGGSKAKNK